MLRRPPRSTRTVSLFPYSTRFRSIVSCGAPRRFLLSPVSGGESLSFDFGLGDLLVMGGTIQRTWRHGIPKTTRPVGPRSEEHTSELQTLMRISYAVFCLKNKKNTYTAQQICNRTTN